MTKKLSREEILANRQKWVKFLKNPRRKKTTGGPDTPFKPLTDYE